MQRILFVHWNAEEAAVRAASLRALGYEVDYLKPDPGSWKELQASPPAAVVIDLSRLPSHGREVGMALRQRKTTRLVPLVFVEGAPEKIEKVQSTLPDARYTTYAAIGPVLEDLLSNPPGEVVVPKSLSGPASPVPLLKKLGAREGQTIGLIHAPEGFERLIPGAVCKRQPRGKVPLTLWFVVSRRELESALPKMYERAVEGGIWIIWPKKASGAGSDLHSNLVREICLAKGLVDFKICAVDDVWTGMRFAVKRQIAGNRSPA
jgi:CheY-like chemotaxis protein